MNDEKWVDVVTGTVIFLIGLSILASLLMGYGKWSPAEVPEGVIVLDDYDRSGMFYISGFGMMIMGGLWIAGLIPKLFEEMTRRKQHGSQ